MLSTFSEQGYSFVYPSNWELVDPQFEELPYSVGVQSPEGAFWTLTIYPVSRDPEALVEEAVEAMRSDYEQFEYEPFKSSLPADLEPAAREMTFIFLDFVVTSRAIAFRRGRATVLVQGQAESRDYERLETVFEAMTASFLRDADMGDGE